MLRTMLTASSTEVYDIEHNREGISSLMLDPSGEDKSDQAPLPRLVWLGDYAEATDLDPRRDGARIHGTDNATFRHLSSQVLPFLFGVLPSRHHVARAALTGVCPVVVANPKPVPHPIHQELYIFPVWMPVQLMCPHFPTQGGSDLRDVRWQNRGCGRDHPISLPQVLHVDVMPMPVQYVLPHPTHSPCNNYSRREARAMRELLGDLYTHSPT